MKVAWIAAGLAALPGVAAAQAYKCELAGSVGQPRLELPSRSEARRVLPIGGYTLALTWAPQACHGRAGDPGAQLECGSGNRFGFTLHGLWPDGVGKEWPQYCTSAALLPRALIRRHLCSTPSAQLIQHEWAKHGTCMATTPAGYIRRSTGLYARLRYPDMDSLSRRPLTAGRFAAAMAAANPGLAAGSVRVTANRQGWLDELWLCLDRRFAYARCRPGSGGLPADAAVRVWRGPR
jgi:ribonuclease T2